MLIGIARMAAEAAPLEQKRRGGVFPDGGAESAESLRERSDAISVDGESVPGCEFGCRYCYARSTHEFLELRDPGGFRAADLREGFPAMISGRVAAGGGAGVDCDRTATDPYQPAERRYGLTREVLRVFSRLRGFSLSVTTKSDLIGRDAELLGEIAASNAVMVNMTVTTLDESLARELEPMAPRPDLRMVAVCKLAAAGVDVGVYASPVMPFLNDGVGSIMAVAKAAREAGAVRFGGRPLFLQPVPRGVFLDYLRERHPTLLVRYQRMFARGASLDGATVAYQKALLRRAAVTFGFPNSPPVHADPQLKLFGG